MAKKERKLNSVADCGKRLFEIFREQQRTHGNEGCMCKICETDMVKAFEILVEKEGLYIHKSSL